MVLLVLLFLVVLLERSNAFIVNHARSSFVSRYSNINSATSNMRSLKVLAGLQGRLNDGYLEKIDSLKQDFERLSSIANRNDDEAKMYKQCKVVLDCVDALTSIDKDLLMFSEHLEGDDESLKSTAKVFIKEFTECKEQMVEQLNKLL